MNDSFNHKSDLHPSGIDEVEDSFDNLFESEDFDLEDSSDEFDDEDFCDRDESTKLWAINDETLFWTIETVQDLVDMSPVKCF